GHATLLDFVDARAPLVLFDRERLAEIAGARFEAAVAAHAERSTDADPLPSPAERYVSAEAFAALLAARPALMLGTWAGAADADLDLGVAPQPSYAGDLARLRGDV